MNTIVMPRFRCDSAWACLRFLPRVRVGATSLVLAVSQLACTDTLNFSPDAAVSTFAPRDLPIEATYDADFGTAQPSIEARQTADGILHSRDHAGGDFLIVDKKHAKLYVFGADGRLRGESPVLLGSTRGDHSVPNIGTRPIDQVRPEERTTPAGRFVAERGRNTLGEDVVWVDYDAAVSMHRVRATNADERRLERLETPSAHDNRISYGCINIPAAFYETIVAPTFAQQRAVVYVLPELKPLQQVFSFNVSLRGS